MKSSALAWLLAWACPLAASAQQSEAPALVANALAAPEQGGNQAPAAKRSSPWLLVPLV